MTTKLEVTICLRSGGTVVFWCDRLSTGRSDGNKLSSIEGHGQIGFPDYVRLDAIDAVVSREVPWPLQEPPPY